MAKKLNNEYRNPADGFFVLNNSAYKGLNENMWSVEDLNEAGLTNEYWKTNNTNQLSYVVGKDFVLVDCDTRDASNYVEMIVDKLKVKCYSYYSTKSLGKKHFWFSTKSSLIDEYRSKFSISNANQRWIEGVDFRGYNAIKETTSGVAYLRNVNKPESLKDRPTPQELIANLIDLDCVPLILLVDKKWKTKYNFQIPYNKVEGEDRGTYDSEFANIIALKRIGLSFNFFHQLHKEMVTIFNLPFRDRDDNEGMFHERWLSCDTEMQIEKVAQENGEITLEKLIEDPNFYKELDVIYYKRNIWIKEYTNYVVGDRDFISADYVSQLDYFNTMNFNQSVLSLFERYLKHNNLKLMHKVKEEYEPYNIIKNSRYIVPYILQAINTHYTNYEIINMKENLVVFQDGYINNRLEWKDEKVFSFFKLPFNFKNLYIPQEQYDPKIVEYLTTMLGNWDKVLELMETLGFALTNKNSGRLLILQGNANIGKTLLATMLFNLLGANNTTLLNTKEAFESGYSFAFRSIALKTLVIGEELGQDINQTIINDLKQKVSTAQTINFNRKNANDNQCDNSMQFLISTNNKPIFPIYDDAMFSRIQYYELNANQHFIDGDDWVKDIDPDKAINYNNWAPTLFSLMYEGLLRSYHNYKNTRADKLPFNDVEKLKTYALEVDEVNLLLKDIMEHYQITDFEKAVKIAKQDNRWPSSARNKTRYNQYEQSLSWIRKNGGVK